MARLPHEGSTAVGAVAAAEMLKELAETTDWSTEVRTG